MTLFDGVLTYEFRLPGGVLCESLSRLDRSEEHP